MEILKIVVLIFAVVQLICLPIFIWVFGKLLYNFQKMIVGIRKETYTKGYFLLGPFLLANEKNFTEDGRKHRAAFFSYFIKASILFLVEILLFFVNAFIRNGN